MLRSQMAVAAALNLSHGLTPPRTYPISKTAQTRRPDGREVEIDVDYGTDDNEEPVAYPPGKVAMEQMSSERWMEGAQMEPCKLPHSRGLKGDPPVNIAAGHPQWPLLSPVAVWI